MTSSITYWQKLDFWQVLNAHLYSTFFQLVSWLDWLQYDLNFKSSGIRKTDFLYRIHSIIYLSSALSSFSQLVQFSFDLSCLIAGPRNLPVYLHVSKVSTLSHFSHITRPVYHRLQRYSQRLLSSLLHRFALARLRPLFRPNDSRWWIAQPFLRAQSQAKLPVSALCAPRLA